MSRTRFKKTCAEILKKMKMHNNPGNKFISHVAVLFRFLNSSLNAAVSICRIDIHEADYGLTRLRLYIGP